MDARIDADEERLCDERRRSAVRAVRVQGLSDSSVCLRREEGHFKVHNRLLLRWSWPRTVTFRMADRRVHGLMRQVGQQGAWVVRKQNLGCSRRARRFSA